MLVDSVKYSSRIRDSCMGRIGLWLVLEFGINVRVITSLRFRFIESCG